MKKFGWCFIGTGTLANQVAKEILASGRHTIVSCYTRNFENAEKFANQYGCVAADSAEAAILTEGVEGVYIVTPHNAHHRYAKLALSLGKSVLCEKAFTVTAEEAEELIALAKEKKVYLCEAMWTWFGKPANQVKSWIDQGKIGVVREAQLTYCMNSIQYAPRVSDAKRAGGALLDITVYPITYVYRLFGYPTSIESKGLIQDGIDLWNEIRMTFPAGERVSIRASIVDFKGLEKLRITGDSGQIKAMFYHAGQKVTLHKGVFRKEVYRGNGRFLGYLPEFDTVASEIREGLTESRMVPLKATSDVMHILDTIREQIGLDYPCLE